MPTVPRDQFRLNYSPLLEALTTTYSTMGQNSGPNIPNPNQYLPQPQYPSPPYPNPNQYPPNPNNQNQYPGPYHYPSQHNNPHQYQSYNPNYNTTAGSGQGVVVRGEEIGIVLVVLILWVGAIILFFNRWGKIRMLEPYQPKFCEHHNPNCPMADVPPIPTSYPRTFSKFNLSETGSPHFSKCNYHGITTQASCTTEPLLNGGNGSRSMSISMGGLGVPSNLNFQLPSFPRLSTSPTGSTSGNQRGGQNRLRQNSVFVTSPNFPGGCFGDNNPLNKNTGRKTKSAVDLSTLVLSGEFMDNVRRNSKNSITNL